MHKLFARPVKCALGSCDTWLCQDAFISIATSSQRSPLLAVQLQVTNPADVVVFELDAPVIALGVLIFHSCVQVGLPSVTPP